MIIKKKKKDHGFIDNRNYRNSTIGFSRNIRLYFDRHYLSLKIKLNDGGFIHNKIK